MWSSIAPADQPGHQRRQATVAWPARARKVEIFKATLELEGSSSQRERAYRHLLIARSLERIGDNAVDIAEQAAFLETRKLRQFTDASTPRKRLDPSS